MARVAASRLAVLGLAPETEASIRAALQRGDIGMRKVAVQFGVATGTVQRIARWLGASVAA